MPTHSFLDGCAELNLEQETKDIPEILPRAHPALPKQRFYISSPAALVPTSNHFNALLLPSAFLWGSQSPLQPQANLLSTRAPEASMTPNHCSAHKERGAACSKTQAVHAGR